MLQQDEVSYTSILCCKLDKYLFPNREDGCAIHQPVLAGSEVKNCPDGLVAKLSKSQPLLVYDFKKNESDMELARNESLGHCMITLTAVKKKVQLLFIMPLSFEKAELYLCWPTGGDTIVQIDICGGPPSANFFRAVKYAITEFPFPKCNFIFQPLYPT